MVQAKRDNNHRPTALAVDENGIVRPLKVDPITGEILCAVSNVVESVPVLAAKAFRDNNYITTGLAQDDTDDTIVRPLLIDNRNGYLFVTTS